MKSSTKNEECPCILKNITYSLKYVIMEIKKTILINVRRIFFYWSWKYRLI